MYIVLIAALCLGIRGNCIESMQVVPHYNNYNPSVHLSVLKLPQELVFNIFDYSCGLNFDSVDEKVLSCLAQVSRESRALTKLYDENRFEKLILQVKKQLTKDKILLSAKTDGSQINPRTDQDAFSAYIENKCFKRAFLSINKRTLVGRLVDLHKANLWEAIFNDAQDLGRVKNHGIILGIHQLTLGVHSDIKSAMLDGPNFNQKPALSWALNILSGYVNLTSFMVQGFESYIVSLPKEIGGLVSLTTLNLMNLKVNELPEELFNLTKLASLTIYFGELISVSESITKLTLLRYLELSNNKLIDIPVSVLSLPNLDYCGLSDNPLQKFLPNLPLSKQIIRPLIIKLTEDMVTKDFIENCKRAGAIVNFNSGCPY